MKIQFLNGGLANQAFQYIFTRYYELAHPNADVIYMDDSYFALNTVHNGYELEKVFGIRPHMLSECFDEEVWDFILEERRNGKSVPAILCENGIDMYMLSEVGQGYRGFNPFEGRVITIPCNQYLPDIQNVSGDIYYHGYWINHQWFMKYKDIFRKEFCFPEITDEKNQWYQRLILENNAVSVHIRRGDYVKLGLALQTDYYRICMLQFMAAVKREDHWHLIVFSDDIDWCRAHESELGFSDFYKIVYIEGNTNGENFRDMQLMSLCNAMILSNSAFCYLAALLNIRRKLVINLTQREL